jgi:hypothetical protein
LLERGPGVARLKGDLLHLNLEIAPRKSHSGSILFRYPAQNPASSANSANNANSAKR